MFYHLATRLKSLRKFNLLLLASPFDQGFTHMNWYELDDRAHGRRIIEVGHEMVTKALERYFKDQINSNNLQL